MPFFYKESGVWKTEDTIYAKVSGEWKEVPYAYLKQSGAWKRFHGSPYIPAGAIVMYDSTTIPTGWTRVLNEWALIRGWDGSSVLSTGGGFNFIFSIASAGAHTGTNFTAKGHTTPAVYLVGLSSAGAHGHTATANGNSYPAHLRKVLIQADANQSVFPAGAHVFAGGALSGLTELSASDLLLSGYSNPQQLSANTGDGVSTSSNGAHTHGTEYKQIASLGGPSYTNNGAGGHGHSFSIAGISWSVYRIYLKAFGDAVSQFGPQAGMILGWTGLVAPPGYLLCDGNNGTIDLRNRFISLDSSQTPGGTTGATTVSGSYNTGNGGGHGHQGTAIGYQGTATDHSNNVAHSHSGSYNVSQHPAYRTLSFIQANF